MIAAALALALAIQCPDSIGPGSAQSTAPNYCTALIPTPDLDTATAALELAPAPSPFGVAVTVDGHPRYRLTTTIAGLPAPSTLGPYTVYVAWATSLTLDSVVKLGVVRNGRTPLGDLDRNQFRVLVSAERSAAVATRHGRLVLRGTSPSTRVLAHRDFSTPFAPGAVGAPMPMAEMANMANGGFLPGSGIDASTLPEARPSSDVALRSGDTLTLTARLVRHTLAGRPIVMYSYNGQIPGPRIRVPEGATIVVRFVNAIDLPSAIHWHGVRLDNRYDGAVGLTQNAVPPGDTFVYRVRFPDPGLYWYHAHDREDVEQAMGLYGSIIVAPRSADYYGPANQVEMLTLDDILLATDGVAPYGAAAPTHALMGRFGNVLLVNGTPRYAASVPVGSVVRFELTNVSNARTYNLSFTNARAKVVASDVGRFARESWVESIVIAPAERYIVDVYFPATGRSVLMNRVQALDHPSGTIYPETDTLGIITVRSDRVTPNDAPAFEHRRSDTSVIADAHRYQSAIDRPPDHTLVLAMRVNHLPDAIANMLTGASMPVDWNDGMRTMNRDVTSDNVTWVLRDHDTGAENMAIHWRFAQGTTAKIRIYNDPTGPHPMDHPIHVHGQRMLVLSRNGVPNPDLVWKDTVLIPAGQIVDVLIDMANPGRWMLHCHIAEHREAGMMMAFDVDSLTRSALR
jgi:suppressor of ftsI